MAMADIEWVMANYSQPQLLKNRRSILNALAFANVVLLILVVAGRTSITAAVVFSLIFLAVAGVMWWLFASKDSSTIDGTWVDGWNDSDEAEAIRSTYRLLPIPGRRRRIPLPEDQDVLDDSVNTDPPELP